MHKNTKILLGVAVAGVAGYFIFKSYQKNKSAGSSLTADEKAQAEKEEADIAAKPEAEQRQVYSQSAIELVDILLAGDDVVLSFDGQKLTATDLPGKSDAHRQDAEARQRAAEKLKELIAQNKLTTDELKTIHDVVKAKKKKYAGKKSKGELNSSLNSIFYRYGVDLPTKMPAEMKMPSILPKSLFGISLAKTKANDNSHLNFYDNVRS